MRCTAFAILACAAPLWAVAPAVPGLVNSFDGEVSINGVALSPAAAGSAVIGPGQVIKTRRGMAEILLTPGTFLRLGNRSELTLAAADPKNVDAELLKGEALVEVLEVPTGDSINLEERGARATIQTAGLYDFNRNRGTIAVYAGSVKLMNKTRSLREFPATADTTNPLYTCSRFRSQQLSLESASSAQEYTGNATDWRSPAWSWNPWTRSYTFLSASGFVNGPFGWPFYAPGHSHNYIPEYRGGDSFLYGRPIAPSMPATAPTVPTPPRVPLNAPGFPQFPNNRTRP